MLIPPAQKDDAKGPDDFPPEWEAAAKKDLWAERSDGHRIPGFVMVTKSGGMEKEAFPYYLEKVVELSWLADLGEREHEILLTTDGVQTHCVAGT